MLCWVSINIFLAVIKCLHKISALHFNWYAHMLLIFGTWFAPQRHLTPAFSKHSNHYADVISCTAIIGFRFEPLFVVVVVAWFCFVFEGYKWFAGTHEPTRETSSCNNNRPQCVFVEPHQHLSLNGANLLTFDNNKNFTFLITQFNTIRWIKTSYHLNSNNNNKHNTPQPGMKMKIATADIDCLLL